MKYHEQLKHPLWQKKRLEVLEYHKFQCQECGSHDDQLHVHHPYYKRGALIWDYDKEELQSLCEKCHKDAHEIDEKLKKRIAILSVGVKSRLLGYTDANQEVPLYPDSFEYSMGVADWLAVELLPSDKRILYHDAVHNSIVFIAGRTGREILEDRQSKGFSFQVIKL